MILLLSDNFMIEDDEVSFILLIHNSIPQVSKVLRYFRDREDSKFSMYVYFSDSRAVIIFDCSAHDVH